ALPWGAGFCLPIPSRTSMMDSTSQGAALRRFTLFPQLSGAAIAGILIAIFLMAFLILPVAQVSYVAFLDARTGVFTLQNFQDFFNTTLFRESFVNSFYVSAMSV